MNNPAKSKAAPGRPGATPARQPTRARLLWRRFFRHRLGLLGAAVVGMMIVLTGLAEFFAPHHIAERHLDLIYAPPQVPRFVGEDGFRLWPFVYGYQWALDSETGLRQYRLDRSREYPVRFFVRGDRYSWLGLFESDLHFIGTGPGNPFHLLGTDRFGRDLLSRILVGGRVSLAVGLFAVALSLFAGTLMGLVSGYFGGKGDFLIQRGIEIIFAFPQIPILMALSALLPADWPPMLTFFGIVTVLAFVGWGGLAREIRGKALVVREADYVTAARIGGVGHGGILIKHMLPAMYSHIIVVATLAIPLFILGESTLSFLGLGIKPPMTSWGLLLSDAMNLHSLTLYPWLLFPGLFIIISVMAFNFLGDGIRDVAAPDHR